MAEDDNANKVDPEMCSTCGKEKVAHRSFDQCLTCAEKEIAQFRGVLIYGLHPPQLELFLKYEAAVRKKSLMVIMMS